MSYAALAARYRAMLKDASSFTATTLEEMLSADVLQPPHAKAFRERYLWD